MIYLKWLTVIILVVNLAPNSLAATERIRLLTRLVRDLITNEEVPSVFGAVTCWSKRDEFFFVNSLPIPTQMMKTTAQIQKPQPETMNKYWFFVDMKCTNFKSSLNEVNMTYFAHPFRWILVDVDNEALEHLPLFPDSNVIVMNSQEKDQYTLTQPYRTGKNSSNLIFEHFGYGNSFQLIDNRPVRVLSRRRRNLMKHPLIVSFIFMKEGSENHTDLDDYNHNRIETVTKLSYLITKHWIEPLNATVIETLTRDWGYSVGKTGRLSGMMGELLRKEADVGGTLCFFTKERVDYLEYLSVTIPTEFAFVLRSPPLSYVSNIYYLPFTGVVWICAISLTIVSITVVVFTYQASEMMKESKWKISDYFMLGIASVCQTSTNQASPNRMSYRIAMFFFLIGLLFIYTSFTANIVALLQSTTNRFRNLEDLQDPAIELGVHDANFIRFYFKKAEDPVRKTLYDTKIAPPDKPDRFMNLSEGVALMRKGMFAFHMEVGTGYLELKDTFYENEKCGLVEIPFLQVIQPWMVIQKHSPYKEILKVSVMKLREHGIQQRERARLYTEKPKCDSKGQNFGSVRLTECYAVFLIFGYGVAASIILLIAEHIYLRIKTYLENRAES